MEKKITCPVCFSDDRCFEDVQEQADKTFSSFMCFKCGYTSNSAYKWESPELKQAQMGATQLMNDVSFYDEEREIMWFPTVLNMGDLGVIYPEGSKNNWVYKYAQVRKLTELEKKDSKYEGHHSILDVEDAKTYGQYEFLEACKDMGIIKDLDGNS
mgnify:FL=1|jgi:hypothetical protein|tara:strand:+ start:4703 stop:5170 length:468 start_codon:yes stop_codon:yes gene_type:complete